MFTALREKLFGSKNGLANGSSTANHQQGRSRNLAKSRLHFVLVQDRTGLTPEEMTEFKRSMVEVIERYFEIDEHGFDISYKRETDTTTLLINSPVIVRRKASPGASKTGTPKAAKEKATQESSNSDEKAPTDAEVQNA